MLSMNTFSWNPKKILIGIAVILVLINVAVIAGQVARRFMGPSDHGFSGRVTEVGTSSIAIENAHHDQMTIAVSSSTVVQKGSGEIPLDQLSKGSFVVIFGTGQGENLQARTIRVVEPNHLPENPRP